MRLLCTVLFFSVFFVSSANAQSPNDAWEFGLGPHVVFREGSTKIHLGGGVTVARRFEKIDAVVEAGGTRRDGHNDWRIIGGPRLMFGGGARTSFFVQALAGTLIRRNAADWAVVPGFGIDARWTDSRAVRFQFDAPIERSQSHTASSIRASIGLAF
jgi:hypothetical protein